MTDRLFIRINDDFNHSVSSNIEWSLYRDSELVADGSVAELNEISDQLPQGKVIYLLKTTLLVPAEWVTLTTADIPSQQAKHILKALPFALEEQLATDIDDLHFALGDRKKGEPIPVAVVDRDKMDHWLAECEAAEIFPDNVIPDSLALFAGEEHRLALLLDGGRALLRLGKYSGLAVPDSQLSIVLDSVLNRTEEVEASDDDDEDNDLELANTPAMDLYVGMSQPDGGLSLGVLESDLSSGEFGKAVDCQTIELPHSVTSALAAQLIDHQFEKNAINLLQGDFKVQKKRGGISLRWQPLAATLAVFIIAQLGMMIGQTNYYEAQAQAKDQEARKLFKKHFPDVKRIRDVRRQFREKIAGGGEVKGDQFLYLVYQSGEQIFALNKSKKDTVELDRLIYDEGQQNLRVEMRLTNFPELDKLKNSLEQKGLSVQIDQAVQDKDRIKARLRIKA